MKNGDIDTELSRIDSQIRNWERKLRLSTTKIKKLRQRQRRLLLKQAEQKVKAAAALADAGRSFNLET